MEKKPTVEETLKAFGKITNKYTAEKLMTMLDKEKLAALEEEFETHPDGLEAKNFVWLMKCAMSYKPEEKYDLVHGLYKLFAEIDINGDCKMQWSEFTQYVIDAVMQDHVKVDEAYQNVKKTQKEIVEEAHSKKFDRYAESPAEDHNLHEGIIRKAIYISSISRICVLESKSTAIKFYNTQLKKKEIVDTYSNDIDLNSRGCNIPKLSKNEKYPVLCVAYNEKDNFMASVSGDRSIQLFSMISDRFRRISHYKAQDVQYGIWYMPNHGLWVTASKEPEVEIPAKHNSSSILSDNTPPYGTSKNIWANNYINTWAYNSMAQTLMPQKSMLAHKAQIMDCVELFSPASIVTCSLDRAIRAWDSETGVKLGSFKPKHTTGVRSLDYTPDFTGYILSVGHENNIKIWSPEVSIQRSYVGSLEGHNSSVISAKFIPGAPLAVSIDEKLTIRIWDLKSMSCLQVISQEKNRFECGGLIIIPASRRFGMFGRRLILYEKVSETKRKGNREDEQYPYQVVYDEYYKTFVVVTKIDLRVYNGTTGELEKIFPNLQKVKGRELSAFCLGERQRKFYIGDVAGSVREYNVSNGVVLKSIGEYEENEIPQNIKDENRKSEKDALNRIINRVNTDHKGEISGLYFVKEDNLLITTSSDSTINIYDESIPESAPRLRHISGGHGGKEVTYLTYDEFSGLFATGCSNGMIVIWDYEMSRVEGICNLHSREIIKLEFMREFPVLVSCAADGYMMLWGMRGCEDFKQRFSCLCILINAYYPDKDEQISLPVRAFTIFTGVKEKIEPTFNNSKVNLARMKEKYEKMIGIWESKSGKEEDSKINFLDLGSDMKQDERQRRKSRVENWGKTYMILGDEKGRLRAWDLTNLLKTLGISPLADSYRSSRAYFNPRRKGVVDVESQYQTALARAKTKIGPFVISEKYLLFSDSIPHKDLICDIEKIDKPKGYISSSFDRHFMVWSIEGELWGDISTHSDNPIVYWRFPIDFTEERKRDKQKVVELIKQLEPNEDVKEEYLDFGTVDSAQDCYFKIGKPTKAKKIVFKKHMTEIIKPASEHRKVMKKVSLKDADMSKRTAPAKSATEKKREEQNTIFSPKVAKKKMILDENDKERLSKDVLAMLDTYNESPKEKKFSIYRTLESLKDQFHKDYSDILTKFDSDKLTSTSYRFLSSGTPLPLYFAKDSRPPDLKALAEKYACSSEGNKIKLQRRVFTPAKNSTQSPSSKSRITTSLRKDKSGILEGLRRLDIVRSVGKHIRLDRNSGEYYNITKQNDVRYTPRETSRQIGKSIMTLSMKKLADIRNYSAADTTALNNELSKLKSYKSLPRLNTCIAYSNKKIKIIKSPKEHKINNIKE